MFGLDSTCFLSGKSEKFITCILNSKVGHFLLKDSPTTGTGDLIISVQAINPLPVPQNIDETPFNNLVDKILKIKKEDPSYDTSQIEDKINSLVYELFELNCEDIAIIEKSLES